MSSVIIKTKNHKIRLDKQSMNNFWSFVIKTDVCWFWRGEINSVGYGIFRVPKNPVPLYCHRVTYILKHGKIPKNKPELDHLCKYRLCCNPDHLEPVTRSENVLRINDEAQIQSNSIEYKKSLGRCDFNLGKDSMIKNALDWKLNRITWFPPSRLPDFQKAIRYLDKKMGTGQINWEEMFEYYNFWFGAFSDLIRLNKYRFDSGRKFSQIPPDEIVYARERRNNTIFVHVDQEWYENPVGVLAD